MYITNFGKTVFFRRVSSRVYIFGAEKHRKTAFFDTFWLQKKKSPPNFRFSFFFQNFSKKWLSGLYIDILCWWHFRKKFHVTKKKIPPQTFDFKKHEKTPRPLPLQAGYIDLMKIFFLNFFWNVRLCNCLSIFRISEFREIWEILFSKYSEKVTHFEQF